MNNRINEIRRLLERWYAGATTPEEERRLTGLFKETRGRLPADLETDARLFADLDGAVYADVEMPGESAGRIGTALDAEIARDRHDQTEAFRTGHRWRLRFSGTAAVAACLLCMWFGFRTVFAPDNTTSNHSGTDRYANITKPAAHSPKESAAASLPSWSASAETPRVAAVKPAVSRPQRSSKSTRPINASRAARAAEEIDQDVTSAAFDDNYTYLSAEEEELLARNYHVVTDDREASALINGVFGRLEGAMVTEAYRVQDISLDYDSEINNFID